LPSWYLNLLAADRLHCSVFELMRQPITWRERALVATSAENEAQDVLARQAREQRRNSLNS
jgi:hypothetical protein